MEGQSAAAVTASSSQQQQQPAASIQQQQQQIAHVKLVHVNPQSPSISLSQSSASLCSGLSVSREHVGARVLLQSVGRASESAADGGLTALHLAAGLLRAHYDSLADPSGPLPPIPVSVLLAGHQLALRWCLDFLTTDHPARRDAAAAATAATGEITSPQPPPPRPHPVASIQLSNLPALLAVIRAQLMSKQPLLQLNDDQRHFLSVLTLQAFLKGLQRPPAPSSSPNARAAGTGFSSNIRVQDLPVGLDGGVMRCSLWDGVVLDIPLPIHRTIAALCDTSSGPSGTSGGTGGGGRGAGGGTLLKKYVGLTVVLYNINLTFAESEHMGADVGVTHVDGGTVPSDSDPNSDGGDSYQSRLRSLMLRLVSRWVSLGVTLVACQKVIHPFLKGVCLARGVLPLERLSVRHLDTVHSLAGGAVLAGIQEDLVTPSVLGRIGAIEERVVGRRRYLFLSPAANDTERDSRGSTPVPAPASPAAGITTLLLSAPTLAQQGELSQLLTRIFKILTHMLRTPAVCAGAGATELALAAEIRARVAERAGREKETRERVGVEVREKVRVKATLAAQVAAAKSAIANASAPSPSSPSSSSSPSAPAVSPLSELAALECSLYSAHLSRLGRHERMLGRACLQVADALEDVACFAPWNSARIGAAASASASASDAHAPDGGGLLLEEVKEHFRRFYAHTPPPCASAATAAQSKQSSDADRAGTATARDQPSPTPSSSFSSSAAVAAASIASAVAPMTTAVAGESTPGGDPDPDSSSAAAASAPSLVDPSDQRRLTLASQAAAAGAADPDPLAQPQWDAGADWRLEYEARSAPVSVSAPRADARGSAEQASSTAPLLPTPEPHALYGCDARSASARVVYRVHPSSGALVVDADSVLDPLYAKRAALQVAVEAAGVLLRVDQVVHHQA